MPPAGIDEPHRLVLPYRHDRLRAVHLCGPTSGTIIHTRRLRHCSEIRVHRVAMPQIPIERLYILPTYPVARTGARQCSLVCVEHSKTHQRSHRSEFGNVRIHGRGRTHVSLELPAIFPVIDVVLQQQSPDVWIIMNNGHQDGTVYYEDTRLFALGISGNGPRLRVHYKNVEARVAFKSSEIAQIHFSSGAVCDGRVRGSASIMDFICSILHSVSGGRWFPLIGLQRVGVLYAHAPKVGEPNDRERVDLSEEERLVVLIIVILLQCVYFDPRLEQWA